jgi:hypothetical protein
MLTTSVSYRLITRDLQRSLETTSKETPVALETRYYLDHIAQVKSVDHLTGDYRLFNYAMKAFGLGDLGNAKGFIKKVVEGGIEDPKSLANRLADSRFVDFVKTFNFAVYGESTTASPLAQQAVVDRYVRQTLESEAGADDDGVRLALYFQRQAPHVTSPYDLLADPALWQVVKTAFGFPDEMANAAIEQQAAAVLDRMPISDLHDPAKLDQLITRFTAIWDVTHNSQNDPTLALFIDQGDGPSLDPDLLLTLNSLRHGGP